MECQSIIIGTYFFYLLSSGIKDSSTVNEDSSLGDLGLDSLMGVEIKQTLERDYDLSMPIRDIRSLTFKTLDALSSGIQLAVSKSSVNRSRRRHSVVYEMRHIAPKDVIVHMNRGHEGRSPMFIIHPIEGSVAILEELVSRFEFPVYGFQCAFSVPLTSVTDLASFYLEVRHTSFLNTKYEKHLKQFKRKFCIIKFVM